MTSLFWATVVLAQDLGKDTLDKVAGDAKIKTEAQLPTIIGNLVRIFIGMLGILFMLLTVYAGYLYLTARGEEEKVKHAKETLQRGVIGLIIITAAYAIASFVIGALTGVINANTST